MTDSQTIVPSRVEKADVEPLKARAAEIIRAMQGQELSAFTSDVITIAQVKDGSPIAGATESASLLERLDGTTIVPEEGFVTLNEEKPGIGSWVVPFGATSEGHTVVTGKVKAFVDGAHLKWEAVEAEARVAAAD